MHLHTSTSGHPVSSECFSIVDREAQGLTKNIKEAMYIKVNDPSLHRNMGKFQLPPIWDQVLKDTISTQPSLHMDTNPPTPTLHKGGGTNLFLGKLIHGGVSHNPYTPHTPKTPLFLHPYIYSAIFGKYQYFISLTYFLGLDEVATEWWLQKLV